MKISVFGSTDNRTYNNDMTQKYTKPTSEYYNELTNSGMKLYTKSELDSMVSTFQTRFKLLIFYSLKKS